MSDIWKSLKGPKQLSSEEQQLLEQQNSRLVSEFKANQLETNAQKHWDIFYKRNDTRFFKDRQWTTREFQELIDDTGDDSKRILLEVGCGVGNFVFPLIEDKFNKNYFIDATDFSPRAIEFVKQNPLYDETIIKAFQCDITLDITSESIFETITEGTVDLISMIFVLSAIHPTKFEIVFKHLFRLLKPGGILLFRDYGLHDMAQVRFKAGNKISDKLYMRQDGTRSYYFTTDELDNIVRNIGFDVVVNDYIHRKTINIKENVDKDRVFVQSKFKKPFLKSVE